MTEPSSLPPHFVRLKPAAQALGFNYRTFLNAVNAERLPSHTFEGIKYVKLSEIIKAIESKRN